LQALAPGVDPFTDPRVSFFGDSGSNSELSVAAAVESHAASAKVP
jgi:hypothetical protein